MPVDRDRRKRRHDREFIAAVLVAPAPVLYSLSLRHGRKSPPWKRMAIARALARHNREEMPSPTRVLGCDRSGLYLLLRSSLR